VGLLCVLVGISACSTTPLEKKDGAPRRSVDVSSIPAVLPTVVTRTKAGNKSPYTVLGKTYTVMEDAQGFRQVGMASWYGTKFHGRHTSNGEIYDMFAMTAAHKSIPIPSYVRVTNQQNGRSVIVRVNDRGPFHGDRIIDLSYAAAKKLAYADQGTARVSVEVITPAGQAAGIQTRQPASQPRGNSVASLGPNAYVQVGAFGAQAAAEALRQKLSAVMSLPVRVKQQQGLFKVQIGPIEKQQALQNVRHALAAQQVVSHHVVYD